MKDKFIHPEVFRLLDETGVELSVPIDGMGHISIKSAKELNLYLNDPVEFSACCFGVSKALYLECKDHYDDYGCRAITRRGVRCLKHGQRADSPNVVTLPLVRTAIRYCHQHHEVVY